MPCGYKCMGDICTKNISLANVCQQWFVNIVQHMITKHGYIKPGKISCSWDNMKDFRWGDVFYMSL